MGFAVSKYCVAGCGLRVASLKPETTFVSKSFDEKPQAEIKFSTTVHNNTKHGVSLFYMLIYFLPCVKNNV